VPFTSLEKHQDTENGNPLGDLHASEDDFCNATEFCAMKYYGGILRNPRLLTTDRIVLEALSWWVCVAEVPLEPEDSIDEYRAKCIKIAEQKVDYYEDDRDRCESVVRGTIALLKTKSIAENDRLLVVALLGWIELLLSFMHENHEISNEELSAELIKQLTVRLNKMDNTFQELQQAKQHARERRLLEQQNNSTINTNTDNKNGSVVRQDNQSSASKMPLIAVAGVAAVAILGAAFVLFRNKVRK